MAETAKKTNKNLIIGICAAIAVVIVVVVAVILIPKGAGPIDDSYFVSDSSKYVLNLDQDYLNEDEEYSPLESHMVYFYSGEKITGLTIYYEYADATTAKAAYDTLEAADAFSAFKSVTLDGKYVVFVTNPSDYEELTASDVKSQIEFVELLKEAQDSGSFTTTEEEEE